MAARVGQGAYLGHPFAKLFLVVEVVEPVRRRAAADLPGVAIAPVETHDREVGGRHRKRRRAVGEALWLVDRDVARALRFEKRQRACRGRLVGEPAAAAKLDGHAKRVELADGPADVLAAGMAGSEPRWELEQDGSELAGRLERRQRPAMGLPEQRLGLTVQVAQIDVALAGGWRRQESLERGRQPLGRGAVTGEQGEGLDVEDEAGRGARDPELRVALVRGSVEGGVDLDDRELGRVEGQAAGGTRHAGRIETARGDQRRVGPRAVADEDAPRLRACHLAFRTSVWPRARAGSRTSLLAVYRDVARCHAPRRNVYVVMAGPSSYSRLRRSKTPRSLSLASLSAAHCGAIERPSPDRPRCGCAAAGPPAPRRMSPFRLAPPTGTPTARGRRPLRRRPRRTPGSLGVR